MRFNWGVLLELSLLMTLVSLNHGLSSTLTLVYYHPITNSPQVSLIVLSSAAHQLTGGMQRH